MENTLTEVDLQVTARRAMAFSVDNEVTAESFPKKPAGPERRFFSPSMGRHLLWLGATAKGQAFNAITEHYSASKLKIVLMCV